MSKKRSYLDSSTGHLFMVFPVWIVEWLDNGEMQRFMSEKEEEARREAQRLRDKGYKVYCWDLWSGRKR